MADKGIKYELEKPVENGTEIVKEITLRMPTAKDLREMPVNDMKMGHWIDVIINIGDQPKSVVDKFSFQDTMNLVGILGNFMPHGQATGAN